MTFTWLHKTLSVCNEIQTLLGLHMDRFALLWIDAVRFNIKMESLFEKYKNTALFFFFNLNFLFMDPWAFLESRFFLSVRNKNAAVKNNFSKSLPSKKLLHRLPIHTFKRVFSNTIFRKKEKKKKLIFLAFFCALIRPNAILEEMKDLWVDP